MTQDQAHDPSNRAPGRLRQQAANAIFYLFARRLPYSVRPYCHWTRRVRYYVCREMFASCGRNVNVERGASFAPASAVTIGDNSGVGLNAFISGPVAIGRNVMMGPNCTILGTNHEIGRTDVPMLGQGMVAPAAPIIEDDVWIGANVTILPGRRIGTGAVVGAGSVVAHDVPPFAIVAGNPAKVVRMRQEQRA